MINVAVTTENLSRPGFDPEEGDWVRDTTTINGTVVERVEHEYHAPPPPPEPAP